MIRILIDMNLSPAWVETFSATGMEAAHWSSVGDPRATDRAIMTWAAARSRLATNNEQRTTNNDPRTTKNDLDFGALIAATQARTPSVIQVRAQDILPASLGAQVISAITSLHAELEEGALVSIEPGRARVRILPLQRS